MGRGTRLLLYGSGGWRMLKHEARLIDPDGDAVVAALSAAVAGANKRCRSRLLADDPAKWRKSARTVAATPEGYEMFRGGRGGIPASQVLAAWWTDAIGRKHVVLRGRRVEHEEARRLLHKDELDARPPLFHAYPEYVCRRTMGGVERVVCACGCGAVGTPDSLSWMGATCGPCFDRKQELGAAGLRANRPGALYGDRGPLAFPACSPDGTRVAAVEAENGVSYWDLTLRTRTTMKFSGYHITGVAITSDAKHLLVGGTSLVVGNGLYAAFDLSTDPPTRLESALEYDPPGWGLAALPDPELAVAHRIMDDGFTRLDVVHTATGALVRSIPLPGWVMGQFGVSADGTRAVTSGQRCAVFDLGTGRPVFDGPLAASVVAFSHDGARLFGAFFPPILAARDAATGRQLRAASEAEWRRTIGGDPLTGLAADPGGAFVYAGTATGRVVAFDADTLKLRAAFDWHLGPVRGLCLSADGATLFTAGGDGCVKVWPIRDLLR